MGDRSKIEWTDATWNPIRAHNVKTGKVGWHCEHVSEGCRNCYAERMNFRLGTGLPYKPGHVANGEVELFLDEEVLAAPLRWRKPRMIFVCSMSDVFGDFVRDEWIDGIFAVMALCPQHTFQVLTKRPLRMREYLTRIDQEPQQETVRRMAAAMPPHPWPPFKEIVFPLANVWLGVSVEDQKTADARIPDLLATPAAVRFVSYEPALEAVDFSRWLPIAPRGQGWERVKCEAAYGEKRPRIDWIIAGGESGPNARPANPNWFRSVKAQCQAAGCAFFMKQLSQADTRTFKDFDSFPPDLRIREMPNAA
jgi:protein gp37